MRHGLSRYLSLLFTALLWMVGSGAAYAVNDPDSVSFTLEGCRNDGTIALPNAGGKFVCPDAAYTTGNLGKGWNELDLVPYRITAKAGNSAPASQTYAVSIALDNEDVGRPGYDVMGSDAVGGAPVLNTALSSASCTALSATAQQTKVPGVGGIDKTIYRILTITQAKNTTCVYDWYGRLALGSHLFPGSSLHANLLNQTLGTQGIGSKDVSIPVKEILPQELRKDMSATADSDVQWNLTKVANPTSIDFGNVCASPGSAQSKTVTFRVEWIKTATEGGGVNVVTNVYAKNPAARTITVNVTDKIYKGQTQVDLLDTATSGDVDVSANSEKLVLTHTKTLPSSAGAVGDYLNDVATATYIDKVTGIPVPGTTQATASAQIGAGVVTNSFVAVADSESISGTGLTFSVAATAIGAFSGYTAGTATTGPVDWGITGETSGRYVDFVKTIYLDTSRVTSGTLTDTAVLVASPPEQGGFTKTAGPVNVSITSSASVELTISKAIPPLQLAAGQKIEVTFRVTRGDDPTYQNDVTLTFNPGDTSKSTKLSGLVPDSYTVTETSSLLWNGSAYESSNLVPLGGGQQTKNLTAGGDGVFSAGECAATAAFTNIPAAGDAVARVRKIVDPTGDTSGDPWTFTLTGPGGPAVVNTAVGGGPYVDFPLVLQEGTYTVTETTQGPAWLLTGVAGPGTTTTTCYFTVDYPSDFGKTFDCTFTNQKQGKAQVVKTVTGAAPSGTQAFTFQLRKGASTTQNGTTLESLVANAGNGGVLNFTTYLKPGDTYQMCEIVMPGWSTTLGTFVPDSFIPPDGVAANPNVDNSILCANFTVSAGSTYIFTIDNTPPPGGRALTIGFWKNWASCANSGGKQKPVLDQTLAAAEPNGIVVSADTGIYPDFGAVYSLVLHGSTSTPNVAPSCTAAVNLLNKSTITSGKKSASDPAFNLAAQLVAAQLNYAAGAGKTGAATTAINAAVLLLGKYDFDGNTHGKISSADATTMNNLAKTLDDYNNNR